jgi:hypothetical protein
LFQYECVHSAPRKLFLFKYKLFKPSALRPQSDLDIIKQLLQQ